MSRLNRLMTQTLIAKKNAQNKAPKIWPLIKNITIRKTKAKTAIGKKRTSTFCETFHQSLYLDITLIVPYTHATCRIGTIPLPFISLKIQLTLKRMENNKDQLPKMLSTAELAELLNISKAGVYRLIEQRRIPFYKIMGSLRFDRDDVIAYLKQNRFEPVDSKN